MEKVVDLKVYFKKTENSKREKEKKNKKRIRERKKTQHNATDNRQQTTHITTIHTNISYTYKQQKNSLNDQKTEE